LEPTGRRRPSHGGFFQALADGTYKNYGLDVHYRAGRPHDNNRILLIAGKLDSSWPRTRDVVRCGHQQRAVVTSRHIPEGSAGFLTHPESRVAKLEELSR